MNEGSVEHATIVIERRYPASPERTFGAWADAEAKARWIGVPEGGLELDRTSRRHCGRNDRTSRRQPELHGRTSCASLLLSQRSSSDAGADSAATDVWDSSIPVVCVAAIRAFALPGGSAISPSRRVRRVFTRSEEVRLGRQRLEVSRSAARATDEDFPAGGAAARCFSDGRQEGVCLSGPPRASQRAVICQVVISFGTTRTRAEQAHRGAAALRPPGRGT